MSSDEKSEPWLKSPIWILDKDVYQTQKIRKNIDSTLSKQT